MESWTTTHVELALSRVAMNLRILRAQRRIVGIVLCCANLFFAVCGNVISQELTPNLGNRPGYANLVYDAATGNVILSAAETQSQEFFSFALTRRDDASAFELDAAVLPFAVTDRNTDLLPYQIGQFSDSDTDAAVSAFALGAVFRASDRPCNPRKDPPASFLGHRWL